MYTQTQKTRRRRSNHTPKHKIHVKKDDPDHASPASLTMGEREHALFEARVWPALYRR
jgi:hypothetical protein